MGLRNTSMPTCPVCEKEVSFWGRDFITGACPRCRAGGARPATLGCGTLLLIGIVVAIFSQPGSGELKLQVSQMNSRVEELRKASDAQTEEIRELRKSVEELSKA